jgi:CDP-4-dehydro-6-deoxyglucose reductase
MKFRAGQYIEFILRDNSRRSYSMANAPHTLEVAPPIVELHIRHMPGGKFTDPVFSTMKEKDILRAEGPYGSFYLREDSDKPMVLLASGTGFAPIKAANAPPPCIGVAAARPICTWPTGSKRSSRPCPT